jgi:hypothetical protein
MFFGTYGGRNRQRIGQRPDTSSRWQRLGLSVLAVTLAAGIAGSAVAQDASPEASPAASPVAGAVTGDFPAATLLSETEIEGDSTTIGVTFGGENAGVAVEETEIRPTVILQTTNATGAGIEIALLQVPEGFDPATFSLADFDGTLPEGVTAIGAYALAADGVEGAAFEGLTPGSYVVAATSGESFAFVLTEPAPIEVPDIFASPEATPGATPAT